MLLPEASSFAPLEDFALRQRFIDPSSGSIAAHFRDRLRPLAGAAAAAIAQEATARCPDAGAFEVTFRSDDSPGLVQSRLHGLGLTDAAPVIVSWDPATALVTEWGVFAAHWGDFCYPAADNVCIWPVAGNWRLCYRRYEVFQFTGGSRES